MDFGDILDDWEKRSAKPGGLDSAREAEDRLKADEAARRRLADAARRERESQARTSLSRWLDEYGVVDKDKVRSGEGVEGLSDRSRREAEAKRLKEKKAEDRIDLHGMTQAEAEAALLSFLESAARRGLEKVLVITGKGHHSQGEPVLGKMARRVLEASPLAGRFGSADAQDGGGGALYVILRRRGA